MCARADQQIDGSGITASGRSGTASSGGASTRQHLDFLDLIRGLAVMGVFIFHAYELTARHDLTLPRALTWALLPAAFGWGGVAVFFVVSGFCIHLSYARQRDPMVFFIRRFFRIYPPYLVALLLFALVYPLTRLTSVSLFNAAQLGSHVLLVHNLSDRSVYGINPSFWSLAVEAQLYVLYPLLLMLVSRFGWKWSLGLTLVLEVVLAQAKTYLGWPAWVTGTPLSYWCSWSIGAAIAQGYVEGRTMTVPRFVPTFFVLLLGGSIFLRSLGAISFLIIAILTGIVTIKLLASDAPVLRLPKPLAAHLRKAGLWSYSIYLLHQPLLWSVPRLWKAAWEEPLPSMAAFALCLASWFVIVPISGLFYRNCELPSNAIGKSLLTTYAKRKALLAASNPVPGNKKAVLGTDG